VLAVATQALEENAMPGSIPFAASRTRFCDVTAAPDVGRSLKIAFDATGSGADLVWSHGLTESRAAEIVGALIDWSHVPARVLRYDAPGHGESGPFAQTTPNAWADMARCQLELAANVGLARYIAAGASMGAATAIHAAVLAPERVRALVLVIPPTAWEARAAQGRQWRRAAEVLELRGVEALVAAGARQPHPEPFADDASWRHRSADLLRGWQPAALAAVLRAAATADLPPRDAVAAIDAPALILAWSGDPAHPAATAQELHGLLPASTLHVARSRADIGEWTGLVTSLIAKLDPAP
jgi:pimeloyl-ACP methyl ester carboxylesterase